jgi:hypothetical protein
MIVDGHSDQDYHKLEEDLIANYVAQDRANLATPPISAKRGQRQMSHAKYLYYPIPNVGRLMISADRF